MVFKPLQLTETYTDIKGQHPGLAYTVSEAPKTCPRPSRVFLLSCYNLSRITS